MTRKKKDSKKWFLLVELPDQIKAAFVEAAKRRDWSMRRAAKHAIEAWIKMEQAT